MVIPYVIQSAGTADEPASNYTFIFPYLWETLHLPVPNPATGKGREGSLSLTAEEASTRATLFARPAATP